MSKNFWLTHRMQVRLIKRCKKVTSETNTVKTDLGSIYGQTHRISYWEVTFMLSDGRQNAFIFSKHIHEYCQNLIFLFIFFKWWHSTIIIVLKTAPESTSVYGFLGMEFYINEEDFANLVLICQ